MLKPAANDENAIAELKNLFIKEVSLVDKPANRRPFLLYKSNTGKGDQDMPALTETEAQQIEDALNTPHAKEAEVIKALETELGKALDAAARNKIIAAVRLLGGIDDESVKSVAQTLSGLVSPPAPAAKVSVDDTKKAEPEPAPAKKEPVTVKTEKADTTVVSPPPEIVALAKAGDYAAVLKAATESPAVVGLMVDLLKSRDGEIADLKQWQVSMIQKADDEAVRALVVEAGLPGASIEDQVKLVKSMTSESRAAWMAQAKALKSHIAMADVEKGTSRRGSDSYNPLEEINARTAQMLQKSDGKLSEGDAMMKVLEQDSKLAADYRNYVKGENI
jgi:hypothetical protein